MCFIWKLSLPLVLLLLLLVPNNVHGKSIRRQLMHNTTSNDTDYIDSDQNPFDKLMQRTFFKVQQHEVLRDKVKTSSINTGRLTPLPTTPLENDLRIRELLEELVLKSRLSDGESMLKGLLPADYDSENERRHATNYQPDLRTTSPIKSLQADHSKTKSYVSTLITNQTESTKAATFKSQVDYAVQEYPALQPYLHEASNWYSGDEEASENEKSENNTFANAKVPLTETKRKYISEILLNGDADASISLLKSVDPSIETLEVQLDFLQANAERIKNQEDIEDDYDDDNDNTSPLDNKMSSDKSVSSSDINSSNKYAQHLPNMLSAPSTNAPSDSKETEELPVPILTNLQEDAVQITLSTTDNMENITKAVGATIYVGDSDSSSTEGSSEEIPNENTATKDDASLEFPSETFDEDNYYEKTIGSFERENQSGYDGVYSTMQTETDNIESLRNQLQLGIKKAHYNIVADNAHHRKINLMHLRNRNAITTITNNQADTLNATIPATTNSQMFVDDAIDVEDKSPQLKVASGSFIKSENVNVDKSNGLQTASDMAADRINSMPTAATFSAEMPTSYAATGLAHVNERSCSGGCTDGPKCNKTGIIKSESTKTNVEVDEVGRLLLGIAASYTVNCHRAQQQLTSNDGRIGYRQQQRRPLQRATMKNREKSTIANDDNLRTRASAEQEEYRLDDEKNSGYDDGKSEGMVDSSSNDTAATQLLALKLQQQQQIPGALTIAASAANNDQIYGTRKQIKTNRMDTSAASEEMRQEASVFATPIDLRTNMDSDIRNEKANIENGDAVDSALDDGGIDSINRISPTKRSMNEAVSMDKLQQDAKPWHVTQVPMKAETEPTLTQNNSNIVDRIVETNKANLMAKATHHRESAPVGSAVNPLTLSSITSASVDDDNDDATEITTTNWWHTLSSAEIRKFLNTIFDSAAHELVEEIARKSKEIRDGHQVMELQHLSADIRAWLSADVTGDTID